jgi:hypothetical protein
MCLEGDSNIHTLVQEARFAGKFAGLSSQESIALVSTKIDSILGLKNNKDFVIWEGDPLEFGATVVAGFDGERGDILSCWPMSQ